MAQRSSSIISIEREVWQARTSCFFFYHLVKMVSTSSIMVIFDSTVAPSSTLSSASLVTKKIVEVIVRWTTRQPDVTSAQYRPPVGCVTCAHDGKQWITQQTPVYLTLLPDIFLYFLLRLIFHSPTLATYFLFVFCLPLFLFDLNQDTYIFSLAGIKSCRSLFYDNHHPIRCNYTCCALTCNGKSRVKWWTSC